MQGHIHKRVHSCRDGRESIRWYVVLDVGRSAEGRRRQKWHGGFRTRREAEVARAKLVDALHTGSYVSPTRLSFGEWVWQHWLPLTEQRVKPTTFHSYRRNLELHVLPEIGGWPLQQITPMMLNALYAGLRNRRRGRGALSPKTANYIHTIVHKALADAVDAGLIHANVGDRVRPPRPSHVSSRPGAAWDEQELARFLADCAHGTRLEAIWRLTAMTGMRRGELLGLRWRDVDLGAGRLAVRRTLVSVAYQVVESTPKSHVARTIDLDSETVSMLRAHRERQQADRDEWGTDYHEDDLVAAREDGSPIHPHAFSRSFATLVRDAGLRPIRLHDVRHTHATLALKAGAPVNVVSERLGHASPGFTLKHYAHVLPGMQAAVAAAVADLVRDHDWVG